MSSLQDIVSCMDGYDPDALAVDKARAAIQSLIVPIAANERIAVRASLGRVLGEDVVSSVNVPAHDNSAMDGWAVRGGDLAADGDTALREIGVAYAGRKFDGAVTAGQCVRVMTGAVMPPGTDTVVIQEIVRVEGDRVVGLRISACSRRSDSRRSRSGASSASRSSPPATSSPRSAPR